MPATENRGLSEASLEACRRGDRDALRALYEIYKDNVYSIAFYYFHGNEDAARDATQQVFVKVIAGIAHFRGDAEFTTWLYRLTTNVCMDASRRATAREIPSAPSNFAALRAPAASAEQNIAAAEQTARVRSALQSLPPKLRLPVLLRYFEDLSYNQMAEALGCSPGTVASRLNRGHQLLREKLREWVKR